MCIIKITSFFFIVENERHSERSEEFILLSAIKLRRWMLAASLSMTGSGVH
jgi:hypothetical protein